VPIVYADKIRQLGSMRNDRQSWDSHYEELQRFFLPRRGRWLERGESAKSRGNKMNQALVDPTPRFNARTLASGLHAGSTNPATPWFKLTTPDREMLEFPSVSTWLYTVEQLMRDVFERSNVYSVLPMLYQDGGVFGTAPMTILDHPTRTIHCVPSPVGSYFLATNYDGDVDTKFCEYKMTTKQMVDQFGKDRCSASVQSQYDNKQFGEFHDVLHAIEPNKGREYGRYDAAHMAWSSCYLEKDSGGEERVLKESGFEENPLATLRWELTEITDPYGASPGMDALGLSKALQVQTKQKAKAIDKLVDPPMVGDPALRNEPSSLVPGDVTYAGFTPTGSAPKFQPAYVIKPELQGLLLDIQDIRDVLAEAMYTDLFLAITRADPRNATAEEIAARYQEKILLLGPVLQNHRNGLIKPLIDRTFYVMMRKGQLPPPPPELEGVDLQVEMTGLLAHALRAVNSTSIERFIGFIGQVAKAQAEAGEPPTILDKIDLDQSADEYAQSIGVPPTIVRSDDDVAAIRKDRAKQTQAQAAMAAAQPIAQGAKAAKDLSETQVNGESALDQIVNSQ
jgi:hypothetical protein